MLPNDHGSPDSNRLQWARRLLELCRQIETGSERSRVGKEVSEAWLILNAALTRYLKGHAGRMPWVTREDIEDLAARKSLDLLRAIELGDWATGGRRPEEVAAYLSTVARNGLLDLSRQARRRVRPRNPDRPEWDVGSVERKGRMSAASRLDPPDVRVERREFAQALVRCTEALKPRARTIWFFRIFYGMPSKQIATHPEIDLKPNHIDVILQRVRTRIRDCMEKQGFSPTEMPPGTFVELWKVFRSRGAMPDEVCHALDR